MGNQIWENQQNKNFSTYLAQCSVKQSVGHYPSKSDGLMIKY